MSSDGDNFELQWSTDNSTWTVAGTLGTSSNFVLSAPLPSNTNGTLYVRVVDTDRTAGNKALDLNEYQRGAMAQRAIAHVTQNFSRERMCADTLALYDELLTNRAAETAKAVA